MHYSLMYNRIAKCSFADITVHRERSMRFNIMLVYLSVWIYKLSTSFLLRIQLLSEFRSLCLWAYSSSCYCSGAPMPWSHRAVGL